MYVEIRESHRAETEPGKELMPAVEGRDARVAAGTDRRRGDDVLVAANQVSQRVAAQGVARKQDGVCGQQQAADADAEVSGAAVREPVRLHRVDHQDADEDQAKVEEVAMDVLEDERKGALAEILLARLTHCAR